MRKDDLPPLLRDWAHWMEQAETAGYPDATILWRAMHAQMSGDFQSTVPAGVRILEITGALRRLDIAMKALLADPEETIHKPVKVVRDFYRYGHRGAGELHALNKTALYGTVTVGEALILREINRR